MFGWAQKFKIGREIVANVSHHRCPRSSVIADNLGVVRDLIKDNQHLTVHEIALKVHIIFGSAQKIIRNNFGFNKICARWVPKLLIEDKTHAFANQYDISVSISVGRRDFLMRIVKWDEPRVHYYTPE